MDAQDAPRWVSCPRCKQPALYAAVNPARPFCSARCRSLDLGAWASESYRVAEAPSDDDRGDHPGSNDAPH